MKSPQVELQQEEKKKLLFSQISLTLTLRSQNQRQGWNVDADGSSPGIFSMDVLLSTAFFKEVSQYHLMEKKYLISGPQSKYRVNSCVSISFTLAFHIRNYRIFICLFVSVFSSQLHTDFKQWLCLNLCNLTYFGCIIAFIKTWLSNNMY